MTRALPGWWRRRRRFEQEKLAPVTDELKEQAKRTGQEAIERGKHVAQEAAYRAAGTAKQQGQEVTSRASS